ncbi:nucleotidyltransferase family protein [Stylonychia lemnae]|uniref:Nucleotidyltransferase family protein n=1 Tax=Stylonychia lemnae TaxID=5949 RepID=A0A078AQA3_STYLE|nr:nucleotidyltransferase family protein [Stylonychia lemnae]|eukprot:CDW84585.1 nucleotidyltransferase family protein [Stylonychia lemnae]
MYSKSTIFQHSPVRNRSENTDRNIDEVDIDYSGPRQGYSNQSQNEAKDNQEVEKVRQNTSSNNNQDEDSNLMMKQNIKNSTKQPQMKQQNSMPPQIQMQRQPSEMQQQHQNIQRSHTQEELKKSDNLQSQLEEILPQLQQSQEQVEKHEQVFLQIKKVIDHALSGQYENQYEVFLYGSAITGLSLPNDSDLDITIIFDNLKINHMTILNEIKQELGQPIHFQKLYRQVQRIEMKSGVMLGLLDEANNVRIEIQINKLCELLNSELIKTYAMIDKRFMQLVLLLKQWNRMKFTDRIKRLNQYSLVIMAIARMQEIGQLPYLQKLKDPKTIMNYQKFIVKPFKGDLNQTYQTNISFEKDFNAIKKNFHPKLNPSTNDHYNLAELLLDFFVHYNKLLMENTTQVVQITYECRRSEAIDVSKVKKIIKEQYFDQINEGDTFVLTNVLSQIDKYSLMIIDPFDRSYNPAKSLLKGFDQEKKYLLKIRETLQNLVQKNINDFKSKS